MAAAIPHAFLCPITCDVMDRPVVAADGHSYEHESISRWLESKTTSPLTNALLDNTTLIPNVALRHAIEEWRATQPMAIDPDRLSIVDPEELLGEGSFGRVVAGVLATQGRTQRVAVKTLPALTQIEARAQFERELAAHITAQQVWGRLLVSEHALCSVGNAWPRCMHVAGRGRSVPSAWHVRED